MTEKTKEKKGRLAGIGVGPGDPELLTLKGKRLMEESDFIVIPASGKDVNIAYTIGVSAVPAIKKKDILEVNMPMIRDKEELARCHRRAADQIIEKLDRGENGVFLTLGDPTVYSTYIYVHDIITALGYETEIVPGIPSFCAAAAKLNIGLTDAEKALHIIPASYEGLEEHLNLDGTRVLMKSGKSLGKVKDILTRRDDLVVKMAVRCGMENEKLYHSAEEIEEDAGYFSLLIVKGAKK